MLVGHHVVGVAHRADRQARAQQLPAKRLAIDLGDKRTGLAIGDDETSLVTPYEVVETPRGPALLDALAKHVEETAPDALVIGLPLNMDDTDGRPTVVSKKENNVINVFSGKIDTCVSASEEIESMLLGKINESLF